MIKLNNSKRSPIAGDKSLLTKLCHAIARQPASISPLADELASAGLILPVTANSVKFIEGRSPYEKASMMVTPALDTVNHSPQHGCQLVAILNWIGFEDLATELSTKSEYVY